MITLDIDLSYLSRYYNIATSSLEQYQNKSITQIMQIEAAKGNTAAAEFLLKVTSDPEELAKVFQLVNPKNRYLILMNMNEEDLMKVMEFLQTDEFILGLSIFTQEAIIKLMTYLEPESLATVVLEKMDVDKFLKAIPEEYLDEFLSSDKLDRKMMLKAMEDVDEEQLQKMMENVTGQACYDDKDAIQIRNRTKNSTIKFADDVKNLCISDDSSCENELPDHALDDAQDLPDFNDADLPDLDAQDDTQDMPSLNDQNDAIDSDQSKKSSDGPNKMPDALNDENNPFMSDEVPDKGPDALNDEPDPFMEDENSDNSKTTKK